MKKVIAFFVIIMLVASFGSQMVFSQPKKEKVYGTINYDGFHAVQTGALWSKRPEAKEIFEGRIPKGIQEIKTFEADYILTFVKGEHNSLDGNFLIFPEGEVIYKKEGRWYSSRCANELAYWRKLDEVEFVEKTVEVEKPQPAPAPMLSYWITPILAGGYYGQSQMVDQRTYNNYSSQTNNYICERSKTRPEHPQPKPEAPHASGPGGRGDEGNHSSGPGGRGDGATDDGNHAGGPGGNGNGNNTTGPGGRSSMSRNSGRISPISDVSLKAASTNNRGTTSRSNYSAGNSRTNYSGNSRQSYSGRTGSNYRANYNSGASRTSSANYRPSYNSASRSSYASASRPSNNSRQSSGGGGYNGGSRSSSTGRR